MAQTKCVWRGREGEEFEVPPAVFMMTRVSELRTMPTGKSISK